MQRGTRLAGHNLDARIPRGPYRTGDRDESVHGRTEIPPQMHNRSTCLIFRHTQLPTHTLAHKHRPEQGVYATSSPCRMTR